MSTHWRSPRAEQQAAPADELPEERSAHGDIVLAPIPGLPTRWDALDEAPREPGNGLAHRNSTPPADGYLDHAFTDAGFVTRTDEGYDDRADGDPAFTAPAYEDSAYSDAAFSPAAFDERAFPAPAYDHGTDPAYDHRTFGHPAFDPEDAGRPFAEPSFEIGPYEHRPYDDQAFAAPAVVPGEYPAPLPIGAPLAPDFPVVAPTPPTSLFDDVYKACFRLLGAADLASAVATNAVALSATPTAPTGDPCVAIASAVQACIECDLPDEQKIPFYQHRARLRRDLARRGELERAILAMRHLVGVPPSGVAARLSVPESQVREVGSAWCPDDSRVDSLALLRGIDSWISSDLGSAAEGQSGNELAHLDETWR